MINETKEKFEDWLNKGYSRKFYPRAIIRNLNEVSDYSLRKNLTKKHVFEITDYREYNILLNKLLGNKLFRITNKNTYQFFLKIGKLYSDFLKENGGVLLNSKAQLDFQKSFNNESQNVNNFVFKNNKELDCEEKIIRIISSFFKNGYRLSSNIDFERFKNYYKDEYNEEFQDNFDWLKSYLQKRVWIFDGRAFLRDDKAISKVRQIIENAQSSCVYIDALYNIFSNELSEFKVYSPQMLKVFIEQLLPDIKIRWDYIYLKENISLNDEIKSAFFEREIWFVEELERRFPYIKPESIRQTFNRPEYICIDKGKYTHIDNMDLPEDEGDKIIELLEDKLSKKRYVLANELNLSRFQELNPECSFSAIRDAVYFKFLSKRFSKCGQVITKLGERLSVLDILEDYCRGVNFVTYEELYAFESTLYPDERPHSQCLNAGYNIMVRVSKDLFVSEHLVNFDVEKIDEVISIYCKDNFIPLQGIKDFSLFPYAGYPWNSYLLESYLRKYSKAFKYDVRSANSSNIGVIVRRTFLYKDYDDILAHALSVSPISLDDIEEVRNYLFENGYIGRRNLEKHESDIISYAKALREE